MENQLAGGEGNPLEQRSVNATVHYLPTDSVVFKMNLRYDEVEGGSTPYRQVAGPEDYEYSALSNLNSISTFKYKSVDLTGVFDVDSIDTTITATGAYYRRENDGISDGDFGPIDFIRRSGDRALDTITGELRFDTTFNDRVSTLIGVYANDTEDGATTLTTIVPLALTVPSSNVTEGKTLGIFATLFYEFSEATELTVGVRYDDQELDSTSASTAETYSADELQPRATLSHFWSPEFMTYGSIARGFRGGGQNGPGAPNLLYRGDEVWTYEVGSKSQLMDGKLMLNVAAFYNDYQHFIGQNALAPSATAPGSFVSVDLNTGDVETYGLEAEINWAITDRWTLDGSLTLLHARITDASEFEQTTGFMYPTDRIIFTPDWNYHVGTGYTVPFTQNDLVFNLSLVGKGDRKGSTLSETFAPTMEAYHLVDTFVAYRTERWEVALFAKNLFDEEYFESYIDESLLQRAGVPPFIVSNLGIPGERRRYGIRATVKF
jgi:iron complex outermembrane receptor protein